MSYYEPTIFTLRQAGIHVEPHWFGPVKCALFHTPHAPAWRDGSTHDLIVAEVAVGGAGRPRSTSTT